VSNNGAKPQSSGSGGGAGSMLNTMMGMLGPLAGLGAMMYMMQQQQQQQNHAPPVQPNGYGSPDGVVNSSGQLNCGAPLAYRYSNCNAQISTACMSNITYMTATPVCTQFSARYCNQGYVAPVVYSPYPYPLFAGEIIGNTVVTQPSPVYTVDSVGEG